LILSVVILIPGEQSRVYDDIIVQVLICYNPVILEFKTTRVFFNEYSDLISIIRVSE